MSTTADKLRHIPDLAAEVAATKDAPNPDGRPERHPLTFESKPPVDLAVVDALRTIDPDGYTITPLWHLSQSVRVAWEELRAAGENMHNLPDLAEQPTYASEAGWLLATIGAWQSLADEAALGYIEQGITDCHSELVRLTRQPKPVVLRCPLCSDTLQVQAGDWLRCDSGHEYPGAARLAEQAWPTAVVVESFGITEDRLYQWHRRGKIDPLKPDVKPLYWHPLDVLRALETDRRTA